MAHAQHDAPPDPPRAPGLLPRLSAWLLRRCGWHLDGPTPQARKCVLIAAPHTSNWDFPWMLLCAWSAGLRVRWLGKHTLFWGPLGPIMRFLGGVAVRRHVSEDRVAATARAFEAEDGLVLVIPPEGTRAYTDHWRSGFYHIARSAGVPLVPTALDYRTRRAEFGDAFVPTGDVIGDMDRLRAFYTDRSGRYPDLFGPIRLREEAEARDVA